MPDPNNLKILVVGHKPFPVVDNPIFLPIQVGRSLAESALPPPWIGDNTGDHISAKNKQYCELTALYWAWKNLKDCDFIGLCHYRRYLFPVRSNLYNRVRRLLRRFAWMVACLLPQRIGRECAYYPMDVVSIAEVQRRSNEIADALGRLCARHDILLAAPIRYAKYSVRDAYMLWCICDDLEIALNCLLARYPDYRDAVIKVFSGNAASMHHLALMRRPVLNEYCQWLFPLLGEIEKSIRISQYPQQQRVFGLLAERFLNVWVERNRSRFSVKYVNYAFVEDGAVKKSFFQPEVVSGLIYHLR